MAATNIPATQGSRLHLVFVFEDEDGNPTADFDDDAFVLDVRAYAGAAVAMRLTSEAGGGITASGNALTIDVSAEDMQALGGGTYARADLVRLPQGDESSAYVLLPLSLTVAPQGTSTDGGATIQATGGGAPSVGGSRVFRVDLSTGLRVVTGDAAPLAADAVSAATAATEAAATIAPAVSDGLYAIAQARIAAVQAAAAAASDATQNALLAAEAKTAAEAALASAVEEKDAAAAAKDDAVAARDAAVVAKDAAIASAGSIDSQGVITRILSGARTVSGTSIALAANKALADAALAAGTYAAVNYVVVTEDEGYATGLYTRGTPQLYQVTGGGTVLTRLGPAQEGWNGARILSRDIFPVNEAAPMATPHVARPGPDTWTVTDPDDALSVSGGALVCSGGKGSVDYNRTRLATTLQHALANDKTFAVRMRLAGSTARAYAGFQYDAGTSVNSDRAMLVLSGATYFNNEAFAPDNAFATARDILLAVSKQRSWYIMEMESGKYVLLATAPTPGFITNARGAMWFANQYACTVEEADLVELRGPWVEEYGPASARIPGAATLGQTWLHEADSLHRFTVTTLPSTGYAEVALRRQDNDNKLLFRIAPDGSASMIEVELGVEASLFTFNVGAITAGSTISVNNYGTRVVAAKGPTSGQHGASTSATVAQSARVGRIERLDGGASITAITAWPHDVTEMLAGLGK